MVALTDGVVLPADGGHFENLAITPLLRRSELSSYACVLTLVVAGEPTPFYP